MISRVFREGMPDSWKTSCTILIPKAKKASYTVAKSWRPIQLQWILAKVMERIITERLANLNLLPDNMFGGRKKNGTTDAIQALDTFVGNNKHRNIALTALDIEGGFDHLNLDRTCNIIEQKNLRLAQWVRAWGFHRQTAYRFNGRISRYFKTDKGTPQGSLLSPILFLISIKDTVSIATDTDTIILSYVDDILIATAYGSKKVGQIKHQDVIDRLSSRAKEGGYNFSPHKTEGIHIRTKMANRINPMLDKTFIPQKQEIRWLGY